jgi:hypothetical protein
MHEIRFRLCVLFMVFFSCAISPLLHAQPSREGSGIALTVGFVWGGAFFGDDNPRPHSEFGITIGSQIWAPISDKATFVFEATFQPNRLENPHFDEGFRAIYLQPGIEFGERSHFRPSAGISLQSWSGNRSCNCLESAFALGFAAGGEYTFGDKYHGFPEGVARFSLSKGVLGYMFGFQSPVGWRFRD